MSYSNYQLYQLIKGLQYEINNITIAPTLDEVLIAGNSSDHHLIINYDETNTTLTGDTIQILVNNPSAYRKTYYNNDSLGIIDYYENRQLNIDSIGLTFTNPVSSILNGALAFLISSNAIRLESSTLQITGQATFDLPPHIPDPLFGNDAASKGYVDSLIGNYSGSGLNLYLNNSTASLNVSGYKVLSNLITTAPSSTVSTIALGVDTLIQSFATPSGYPNIISLPVGLWNMSIYAYVSGAGGTLYLKFSLYKRNLFGVETLIATSGNSSDVNAISSLVPDVFHISATISSPVIMDLTDVLVIKLRSTGVGMGGGVLLNTVYEGSYYSFVNTSLSGGTSLLTSTNNWTGTNDFTIGIKTPSVDASNLFGNLVLGASSNSITLIGGLTYSIAVPSPTVMTVMTQPALTNNLSAANTSFVNTALTLYVTILSLASTLLNYVTNSSLASTLSAYVTNSSLATTLLNYVSNSSLATTLLNYVTSSSLSTTLSAYAGTGLNNNFTGNNTFTTGTTNNNSTSNFGSSSVVSFNNGFGLAINKGFDALDTGSVIPVFSTLLSGTINIGNNTARTGATNIHTASLVANNVNIGNVNTTLTTAGINNFNGTNNFGSSLITTFQNGFKISTGKNIDVSSAASTIGMFPTMSGGILNFLQNTLYAGTTNMQSLSTNANIINIGNALTTINNNGNNIFGASTTFNNSIITQNITAPALATAVSLFTTQTTDITIGSSAVNVNASGLVLRSNTIEQSNNTGGNLGLGVLQTGGTISIGTNAARTGTITIGANSNTVNIGGYITPTISYVASLPSTAIGYQLALTRTITVDTAFTTTIGLTVVNQVLPAGVWLVSGSVKTRVQTGTVLSQCYSVINRAGVVIMQVVGNQPAPAANVFYYQQISSVFQSDGIAALTIDIVPFFSVSTFTYISAAATFYYTATRIA